LSVPIAHATAPATSRKAIESNSAPTTMRSFFISIASFRQRGFVHGAEEVPGERDEDEGHDGRHHDEVDSSTPSRLESADHRMPLPSSPRQENDEEQCRDQKCAQTDELPIPEDRPSYQCPCPEERSADVNQPLHPCWCWCLVQVRPPLGLHLYATKLLKGQYIRHPNPLNTFSIGRP